MACDKGNEEREAIGGCGVGTSTASRREKITVTGCVALTLFLVLV